MKPSGSIEAHSNLTATKTDAMVETHEEDSRVQVTSGMTD